MSTRWLVIGAAGMLGTDLVARLIDPADVASAQRVVVGVDRPDMDVTNDDSIRYTLQTHRPDVVVNCAAYTAVDAAESDEPTAHLLNAVAPGLLAHACAADGVRLVHLSTDYVFAGDATTAYAEDARTDPRSAYGRTKRDGEVAVVRALPEASWIVRTAWLYGEHGPNFVATMLNLEAQRETLDVVDDQVGQPTWTVDVADRIVALVDADAPAGTYHATSSGQTSWFGLTQAIFAGIGADPARVHPTTTDRFPRPAPRPAFSVLGHDAWSRVGLTPIRSWQDALAEALPRVAAARR